MAGIAILGYGTVGSGVYEALGHNKERLKQIAGSGSAPYVKKILDIRNFPDDPANALITSDYDEILCDEDIRIVIECMGGTDPAYSFVRRAIESGRHVVTSNKEVVSLYAPQLLELAKSHNVSYLFDASVAGVIPIIRPLTQILSTDVITEIKGIVNGTTNYILSHMENEHEGFDQALKKAASLGYVERDPSADIDGYDAARKLAILLSLTIGFHVDYRKIHTEGIRSISEDDFFFADRLGYTIKLLAVGQIESAKKVTALTAPFLVKKDTEHASILASVKNAYNAVVVKGECMDDVMLYGRGAGKLPTAAAIVSDIVYALAHEGKNIPHIWSAEPAEIREFEEISSGKTVRLGYSKNEDFDIIYRYFPRASAITLEDSMKQFVFFTPPMTESEFKKTMDKMLCENTALTFKNAIRID